MITPERFINDLAFLYYKMAILEKIVKRTDAVRQWDDLNPRGMLFDNFFHHLLDEFREQYEIDEADKKALEMIPWFNFRQHVEGKYTGFVRFLEISSFQRDPNMRLSFSSSALPVEEWDFAYLKEGDIQYAERIAIPKTCPHPLAKEIKVTVRNGNMKLDEDYSFFGHSDTFPIVSAQRTGLFHLADAKLNLRIIQSYDQTATPRYGYEFGFDEPGKCSPIMPVQIHVPSDYRELYDNTRSFLAGKPEIKTLADVSQLLTGVTIDNASRVNWDYAGRCNLVNTDWDKPKYDGLTFEQAMDIAFPGVLPS